MLSAPQVAPLPATVERSPRAAGVERAAWTFYIVAALGSSIGQIWVGVETPPWPDLVPLWLRALLVTPFAVVIDLGGAVASAFADARRRIGEIAYSWRILSAASVILAVGINIVGHAASPYLATVFGGLGVFAYCVWLLHSAARRRDALRATNKMALTPPAYGLLQWKHEPAVTRRARALAIDHGYGLVQSLAIARTQLAEEARRAALAEYIEARIRACHENDPILASIAATTTPIDHVAEELMHMIDARDWAAVIKAEIQPPAEPTPASIAAHEPDDNENVHQELAVPEDHDDRDDHGPNRLSDLTAELVSVMPTKQAAYQRWRSMWIKLSERPDATNRQLAVDFHTSTRTVQRIRAVGAAGLLDAPQR